MTTSAYFHKWREHEMENLLLSTVQYSTSRNIFSTEILYFEKTSESSFPACLLELIPTKKH